ncbi:galactose mutarotase-like enzyme [Synechococcus sp. PCC 7502]|uniref:aldose epimerase family protein n=1 Tax=Synechococcus sp. PCC 7502 TaxID=1173263 RepID=UPI00029FD921|nr:galactose mutarotase [Synechococcus sp. PCC 7502]AFY74187.1 galactose mutarotase-like enzyme [Synechococcus sp. PCC 7502]
MASYTVEQRQYKTYILGDRNSKIEIVPERGGIVTSWVVGDQEIFYMDTERFTHPDLSVRGGIPILFPICGNMPDNTYTLNGQVYHLTQHGFARNLPWQVDTEDQDGISLILTSTPETLAVYPFEFKVRFTYILTGSTLTIKQSYTNLSNQSMPFSAGTHPYFATPDKSELKFEFPSAEFVDQKSFVSHAFLGGFDFSLDEIDVMFFNAAAHNRAIITDASRNLKLTIDFDEHHKTLVFWTVKGKDFVCVEPWTAARNSLNTGENLLFVEPNSTINLQISMTVN